jgi:thymidylate synthase
MLVTDGVGVHSIVVANVNYALDKALWWLRTAGLEEDSRNGKVVVSPGPVATTYLHPRERVLFNPSRDANPFFHFFEALWMLAGRNDVDFLAQFNSRIATYSDDGKVLAGAYGFRWLQHFNIDQLQRVEGMLKKDPNTRRAVVSMWDPTMDLGHPGNDRPCNTHIYFNVRNDALSMMVCCRSNDMIWGAYGSNVVHFSFLQEYLAGRLGLSVGVYTQMSFNAHVYTEICDVKNTISPITRIDDRYPQLSGYEFPMMITHEDKYLWDDDLYDFFERGITEPPNHAPRTQFFREVVHPMYRLWEGRRTSRVLELAEQVLAPDWRMACLEWISRRSYAKQA